MEITRISICAVELTDFPFYLIGRMGGNFGGRYGNGGYNNDFGGDGDGYFGGRGMCSRNKLFG